MRVLSLAIGGAVLMMAGCAPELPSDYWRVTTPRVLAIAALPGEAKPGQQTTLSALVADPQLGTATTDLRWLSCQARTGVAESAPVAAACLGSDPLDTAEIGLGAEITWTIPGEACGLFGPSPPPAMDGQPAGRPADPDATGGFYAPVRVDTPSLSADPVLFRVRLRCPLGGATQAQSVQFNQQYRANSAPHFNSLDLQLPGGKSVVAGDSGPAAPGNWHVQVKAGSHATLRAGWTACADISQPCGGAETYLRYDPQSRQLTLQREAVRVAWYASIGELSEAASGRASTDSANWATNQWIAPDQPGKGWWWLVIRDDRGGVSWQTVRIDVVP